MSCNAKQQNNLKTLSSTLCHLCFIFSSNAFCAVSIHKPRTRR